MCSTPRPKNVDVKRRGSAPSMSAELMRRYTSCANAADDRRLLRELERKDVPIKADRQAKKRVKHKQGSEGRASASWIDWLYDALMGMFEPARPKLAKLK
ncbi:MAG: hypothetical protein COA42_09325 [Alteromonadaceae bacterium]|nr:MAG: hypothetical protein COA42_09325 [Alteromonadaceae bacterium]